MQNRAIVIKRDLLKQWQGEVRSDFILNILVSPQGHYQGLIMLYNGTAVLEMRSLHY